MTLIREAYNETDTCQFPWENGEQEAIEYASANGMQVREVEITEASPASCKRHTSITQLYACTNEKESVNGEYVEIACAVIQWDALYDNSDQVIFETILRFAENNHNKQRKITYGWETLYESWLFAQSWWNTRISARIVKYNEWQKVEIRVISTKNNLFGDDYTFPSINMSTTIDKDVEIWALWESNGDIVADMVYATYIPIGEV